MANLLDFGELKQICLFLDGHYVELTHSLRDDIMKWTSEADEAVKKVPFFVRKKVRERVEKETQAAGRKIVSLNDVKAAKARFLSKMSSEVKGYQIDSCFGPGGCPNRANISDGLLEKIEAILKDANLLSFLKKTVKGDLKFHHEFRITIADCPNACSQPQIKDIGIIGATLPKITAEPCSECGECVATCREKAVSLDNDQPRIDLNACLLCGKCIDVCPTGTIGVDQKGFRVQVGGKLGRHPHLAKELPGLYSEAAVVDIVRDCLQFYKKKSRGGERFGDIINRALSVSGEVLPSFLKKLRTYN